MNMNWIGATQISHTFRSKVKLEASDDSNHASNISFSQLFWWIKTGFSYPIRRSFLGHLVAVEIITEIPITRISKYTIASHLVILIWYCCQMVTNKKYYVVYVTSTCWLVTFLTLLSDVAKRQFQNMQKNFTWIKFAFLKPILDRFSHMTHQIEA